MHLGKSRGKKHLLLMLALLMFGACKQSEFYEKVGLSEVITPPGNNDGGFGPGDGGGGGGGTTNPPVVTPPVTEPPVVVNPPVTEPPVTVPPVVVNPPVTEPPVTVPPVVINPPVTEPPVIENPEVILNDRTELFTQNVQRSQAVDILWVIDDSGSMSDEQTALAANFEKFINQFLEKDIDFRMAITTTDATSTKNGKMVGDSTKLTSLAAKANKATFINNFKNYVKVGTRGSGSEQGLKCSESFMSRYSESFLRKDAALAIVFLTDEEDSSPKTVSQYLTNLQALKENHAHVKTHSIITLQKTNSGESVGARYKELSKSTAGIIGDIKKDFASTLANIGGEIVTLLDSFALNASPYNDEVEVYVDNVKVEVGYTFNSSQRSITFDKASLPAEGSKIEVRYKVVASALGAI